MKVVSVNIDTKAKLSLEHRLAHNKLEVVMHRKCITLSAPDAEIYSAFAELSKIPITKVPQKSIAVAPGGVVGDKHFVPNVIEEHNGAFFSVAAYNQVSILPKERYDELNQLHSKDLQAGAFGENIQTEGLLAIESLPQGTILQFGDTAQIKITHLRTYCYKFANVIFPTADEYFNWKKYQSGGVINRLGVLGQVLIAGTIRPNDPIRIVYSPDTKVQLGYIQRPHGTVSRTPCDPPTNT